MPTPSGINLGKDLYRNAYHSIAGVDIKAVFAGSTFGNLQAISYSITREKAPIYTMGSPETRGYARGKRGIAGSMVMVMFDEHALLKEFIKIQKNDDSYRFVTGNDEIRPIVDSDKEFLGKAEIDRRSAQQSAANASNGNNGSQGLFVNSESQLGGSVEESWSRTAPWYADQIPPFNIILTGVNEEGYGARMAILGVEILNEGFGISIDDLISEQQMTYVCRAISRWSALRSDKLLGKTKSGASVTAGPAEINP